MNAPRATRSAIDKFATEILVTNSDDLLRYARRRVSNPQDAADVYGELIETAWRRRSRMPREPREARMWLFGVAKNVLRRRRRKAASHGAMLEELTQLMLVSQQRQAANQQDDIMDVRQALASIGAADRELLILIHWDGFNQNEAARHLGLNPSTVRSRYSRALDKLRLLVTAPSDPAVRA